MKKETNEAIRKLMIQVVGANPSITNQGLAKVIKDKLKVKLSKDAVLARRRRANLPMQGREYTRLSVAETLTRDREKQRAKQETVSVSAKYAQALKDLERLEKEREAFEARSGKVFTIPRKVGSDTSEAVAVALASDWHLEERVQRGWVGGKNNYDLNVAEARSLEFFQNLLTLLEKEQKAVRIDTLVLWLGGDFITGNIHDENMETAQLLPIEAMIFAEGLLKSGIQFLLDHTKVKLVIPCNAGNHSRITKKQRHSTDVGNSLETIMYHHLAENFRGNPRVKFILQSGYHVIVPVYDNFSIRFHHGHNIKFGGGIGGIYIPAKKAISQWQKSEQVQLDCFGHLHTLKIDTDFICNGSMIGYSPFALAIKADFERPQQCFFLVDKKRGRTGIFPILFKV